MAADDRISDLPLDAEDDLFDFDELIGQSEAVAEELTAELDEALAETQSPPAAAPGPDIAAAMAPAFAPPMAAVEPQPAPVAQPAPATPRGIRPQIAIAALVVVGLANLSLVGLTWKSLDTTRELVSNASTQTVDAAASSRILVRPTTGGLDFPLTSLEGPRPEGRTTLENAERAVEAGEYVQARRAVYSLLAVVDRVRPSEREDVEARASFLIAETYRLEARRLGREAPQ